jgi:hypothetical protein
VVSRFGGVGRLDLLKQLLSEEKRIKAEERECARIGKAGTVYKPH